MNDRVELGIEVDLFAELLGKCCFVISNSSLCFSGSIYHVVYQGICRFTWRFIVGKTPKGLLLCNTCERSSYPVSRWRTLAADEILGSLRNHDDDGTRTSQICIFDSEKQKFYTLCTCSFHFWHFANVLVLSTTWNDLFCSCMDDVTIWWQMFNFVFISLKRRFQFNSRIVRTHFGNNFRIPGYYCLNLAAFFEERVKIQKTLFLFNDMQISGREF